jgi:hypothetical protein
MGFELPIDADYFTHPKTLKLISILGARADVYPLRVWAWASRYARDGVVEGQHRAIELAAGWKQPVGKLVASLQQAGFIDPDGKTLHDWMNGIGRAILIYERKKQKMRAKYHLSVGILPEDLRKPSGSLPPTLDTLDETLHSTREGIQESKPRPVVHILASTWNRGPGLHLNGDKASEHIQAALHVGVTAPEIEQAFMDHAKIKGIKIWEVLDQLRKRKSNGSKTWDEILKDWAANPPPIGGQKGID